MLSCGTKSQANLDIANAFRASRKPAPITMDQLIEGNGDTLLNIRLTSSIELGWAMASASVAISTVARDARQIQWGARFVF